MATSAQNAKQVSLHSNISAKHVRVVILGTGFSGLGMAIQLKKHGYHDFVILERAADLGGTWRDNTYPGCSCDVSSHLYSFSFALNPQWSDTRASQSEIWDYLRQCAKRFGIGPHIQWNSQMLDASWSADEQRWQIKTSQRELTADFLILGNGPLSEPSLPSIPGLENFEGILFHSARWRHDYDLAGQRVAVIGTGASAVQFVPHIQPLVGQLSLFQRTPTWVVPRQSRPVPTWQQTLFRLLPLTQRLLRLKLYWQREQLAHAFIYQTQQLKNLQQLSLGYMYKQVTDPVLRQKLTPHHTIGCKRVVFSDDFYPALTQPNVELVTERIREVQAHSIVTEDGNAREIDALICATGFDTTKNPLAHRVHGRDGQSLADCWKSERSAYLGITVTGFPNLFMLIGPNSGIAYTSLVIMIESQIAYILDCLRTVDRRHIQTVEVRATSLVKFSQEIKQRMQSTVWASGCTGGYLDPTGHNAKLWPGFSFEYRLRTRRFDPQHYVMVPASMSSEKARRAVLP